MTSGSVIHIVGVAAVWTLMLFGVRFAVASLHWLAPLAQAVWHLRRCGDCDADACRERVVLALKALHDDLVASLTTPWSATLLFSGAALIGLAFAAGCLGDIVMLVSPPPERWDPMDRMLDALAAVMAATGMSFVQAATSHRRTISFWIGGAFVVTGLAIGALTA